MMRCADSIHHRSLKVWQTASDPSHGTWQSGQHRLTEMGSQCPMSYRSEVDMAMRLCDELRGLWGWWMEGSWKGGAMTQCSHTLSCQQMPGLGQFSLV